MQKRACFAEDRHEGIAKSGVFPEDRHEGFAKSAVFCRDRHEFGEEVRAGCGGEKGDMGVTFMAGETLFNKGDMDVTFGFLA